MVGISITAEDAAAIDGSDKLRIVPSSNDAGTIFAGRAGVLAILLVCIEGLVILIVKDDNPSHG